jgi:RNA recognition motif-containing protein
MNIYVGNIARAVTEEQLKALFARFGTVITVKLIKDKFTGEARGFGFVEMASAEEGQAAISALDNNNFEGRNLRVNEARPREERPREERGGNGGGGYRGGDDRPRGPRTGGYGSGNGRSSSRY